jgi:hypothetical protein
MYGAQRIAPHRKTTFLRLNSLTELFFHSFLSTTSIVALLTRAPPPSALSLSLARRVERPTPSLSYFSDTFPEVSSLAHSVTLPRARKTPAYRSEKRESEENREKLVVEIKGVSPWLTRTLVRRGAWTPSSRRPSTW